jgi:hypothetical protein
MHWLKPRAIESDSGGAGRARIAAPIFALGLLALGVAALPSAARAEAYTLTCTQDAVFTPTLTSDFRMVNQVGGLQNDNPSVVEAVFGRKGGGTDGAIELQALGKTGSATISYWIENSKGQTAPIVIQVAVDCAHPPVIIPGPGPTHAPPPPVQIVPGSAVPVVPPCFASGTTQGSFISDLRALLPGAKTQAAKDAINAAITKAYATPICKPGQTGLVYQLPGTTPKSSTPGVDCSPENRRNLSPPLDKQCAAAALEGQ